MNSETFNRLQTEAAADMFAKAENAERSVSRKLNEMVERDEVLIMTDEEERMVRSFRRFKLRMRKDGEVFKWQTARDPGVVAATDTALILDPQEVAVEEGR